MCKEAASELKLSWANSYSDRYRPPGCTLYRNNLVYFNTFLAAAGSDPGFAEICLGWLSHHLSFFQTYPMINSYGAQNCAQLFCFTTIHLSTLCVYENQWGKEEESIGKAFIERLYQNQRTLKKIIKFKI